MNSDIAIPLATTIGSIAAASDGYATASDMVRIVNAVSPRNWRFRLSFDSRGQNLLDVSADPPLGRGELLGILDGRIPCLYRFAGLAIRLDGQIYVGLDADFRSLDRRSTEIPLRPRDVPDFFGDLRIIGFDSVAVFQRRDEFRRVLKSTTWFGSLSAGRPNHSLTIELFGEVQVVTKADLNPTTNASHEFRDSFNLTYDGRPVGIANVIADSGRDVIVQSAQFGQFDPDRIRSGFSRRLLDLSKCGWILEFQHGREMGWYSSLGPVDFKDLGRLLDSLGAELSTRIRGASFGEFRRNIAHDLLVRAAERIRQRQDRFRRSPKVSYDGRQLFQVPSCENELVALFMKLEALGALPFECEVQEYTSREGIDALGNFRFRRDAAYSIAAPIEFEFRFENFLAHEHSPEQTSLIVCWDIDDPDCGELREVHGARWRFTYSSGAREVPVVVVSRFPGLWTAET